jgi:hypothetical protein
MSILVLTSDTLIGTPATGNLEYNGQFFGTDSNASRAQLQRIVRATAVASTSGTSIDFTNIPAWTQKITVMFSGVSTNGVSNWLIQIGDSGGIENTGYVSSAFIIATTGSAGSNSTTGYVVQCDVASYSFSGNLVITNITSNTWVSSHILGSGAALTGLQTFGGGTKTLSTTLDRVRITTTNGTDAFDAGSVNIMYEG